MINLTRDRIIRIENSTHSGKLKFLNSKLKRMYADIALENTAIKDVLQRKL